jgi:hypothetical protein
VKEVQTQFQKIMQDPNNVLASTSATVLPVETRKQERSNPSNDSSSSQFACPQEENRIEPSIDAVDVDVDADVAVADHADDAAAAAAASPSSQTSPSIKSPQGSLTQPESPGSRRTGFHGRKKRCQMDDDWCVSILLQ